MNKQQLASRIWESANKMRSKIEANEYKDYILGFIFYKYLSDKEIKFLTDNGMSKEEMKGVTEEDRDIVRYIQSNIGYFIEYDALFSTWLDMGRDFDVSNVTDALSAFSRNIDKNHIKVFKGIFDTLQTGLSKLGDTSGAQTKAISGLLQLIKDIPMDGKQDYDVLGYIYEYLIEKFASNAGKKAGEFYTPHEVSLLMSEIVAYNLKDKNEIKIYDPTSGSGSLLINIGRSVSKYIEDNNNIKYYAQELKESTYNLTRMNLVMRGILPNNIITRNGDTLEEDWPYFDENDPLGTYDPLYVDAVVSNPPYSQPWDSTNKETDPRYARFGIAPKSKADYAFLLHDLYHIKPDGIMTIVLPHGVLFRGGEEGEIRKNLIENNHIDTIIGLPANIFFGTGIPTIIMVLKQKRDNTDILIVDASKGFTKEGKNNKLRASDIKKITDTVINRLDIDKYSKKVSLETIRNNEYNLNIPRYVDSSENTESWDIYASMFGGIPSIELDELKEYWNAFPNLRKDLFNKTNDYYEQLVSTNTKELVRSHMDTLKFIEVYKESFSNFREYLKEELVVKLNDVNTSKEEEKLSRDVFSRLNNIELIDKYEAYQLLDDYWNMIANDIEIIHSEGCDVIKQVDPNMVLKKKNGKEVEVQEGWIGHIIPFELVGRTILKTEYEQLRNMETKLADIPSQYDDILESLTEEEKCESVVNDNNDGFVNKEIPKRIRELKNIDNSDETLEFLNKLMKVETLIKEEKDLKASVKKETARLEERTKEIIENLTEEEVSMLLEMKWIDPLVSSLEKLPNTIIDNLVKRINTIVDKYATTYYDIEKEIKETEKKLCLMMGELVGNEYDMKGLSEFKSLLIGE